MATAVTQREAPLSPRTPPTGVHAPVVEGRGEAVLFDTYQGLARALARRLSSGSVDLDDLTQVALLGLFKAIRRFDPSRGYTLPTLAVPVIRGELKRYLRDHTWIVRPPRRLHDNFLAVEAVVDDLTQAEGRQPAAVEVAACLGLPVGEVVAAESAGRGRQTLSLDAPSADGLSLGDTLGGSDHDFEAAEDAIVLAGLLGRLSDRDAEVVRMRFLRGMTQRDIGLALGCSQMHVSRILGRALDQLRALARTVPAGSAPESSGG